MPADAFFTTHGPDDEIPLPGGNVGGAVRVGDTVRRPTGPWTPAVHELLEFLAVAGLPRIPRVLGVDDQGREILNDKEGVWRCRTTFNCTEACPRGIEVTKAIQEVKRAMITRAF